jgi:hypothetical protein
MKIMFICILALLNMLHHFSVVDGCARLQQILTLHKIGVSPLFSLPSHGPSSSREMTLRLAAQSIIAVNNNPTTLAGGWLRIPPGPPANVEHLERLSRPAPRQLARHADQYVHISPQHSDFH